MGSELLLLKCRLICRILDFMRLKSGQMCLLAFISLFLVSIERRTHLAPFRTQQLSSSSLMILHFASVGMQVDAGIGEMFILLTKSCFICFLLFLSCIVFYLALLSILPHLVFAPYFTLLSILLYLTFYLVLPCIVST